MLKKACFENLKIHWKIKKNILTFSPMYQIMSAFPVQIVKIHCFRMKLKAISLSAPSVVFISKFPPASGWRF